MFYREMPKGYGMVQTAVMKCKISIHAKAIYALLASYTGTQEFCFPSVKMMTEDLQISKTKVIEYLKELESFGLIKKEKLSGNPFNHSNKYKIFYIEENSQKGANYIDGSQVETIGRPHGLTKGGKEVETFYINNNNDNSINKNNNIEFLEDSNESLKTKEAKASLILNTPKEKEFNINPIKNNKEFVSLLEEWNNFPLAIKHTRFDTKTIADAYFWFLSLLDGSFCKHATAITASFLTSIDVPLSWMSRKWTVDEIREGIRRIGLQWQAGYWPHTEEEKKKILPKSLSASFYSPYNKNCPSVFFKVMAKEPIQNGQLTEIEESQYKSYLDIYNVALTINDRDKPRIVKYIKSILNVHKTVCNSLIKVNNEKIERHVIEEELGSNFNSAIGFINIPEILIKNHADFIYECKMSWKDFKLNAVSFSPHGGLWDKFIEWLENKYTIKLWLEDDEAEYLAMRYSNYKRESNNIPKKEKSIKKRIKELEEIIQNKKQPDDVLMLFEEELNKLKSELERKAM
jgi:hypothetical protein